jgi:hypothetical protein
MNHVVEQTIINLEMTTFVNTFHNTIDTSLAQGEIFSSQHKEGWILKYMPILCT